jgi:hypothetical protein
MLEIPCQKNDPDQPDVKHKDAERVQELLKNYSPESVAPNVAQRLPVVVAHDKARGLFFDGPRRRETAFRHRRRSPSFSFGPL